MFWRVAVTATCWFLGLNFQLWDGQTFRNAITLLAAAIIGSLPWIPLAVGKPGTRGRIAAIVILSLSAIVIVLIAIGLPEAYEFQRRFNEMYGGR